MYLSPLPLKNKINKILSPRPCYFMGDIELGTACARHAMNDFLFLVLCLLPWKQSIHYGLTYFLSLTPKTFKIISRKFTHVKLAVNKTCHFRSITEKPLTT